ncbi:MULTISPECIES: thioredoxin [Pseudarthrobacter]|jgi:thioredoxin 2|uniref:Thioredoxin n=1 Tax=Pseudarthrobacter oxydans TaxID=1671 RepID=A0AAW8N5H8_PSEOX|nr:MULTISPECIES: thioredoxin [Pseudarthrobacter]MDV2982453.1 thioredoxin [Actinomycetes bacterium ARC8]WHP60733.1 thioredoxin [Arthrobacter sp. KFRI-F3372]MDR6791368.1 thioredoxin 2 [Pseudarthrobacter oxydans]MDR7162982.1 thioredoxin 2 [Pseudarthrobacter oxydans]NSX37199.1 thioredoxin [Pseudarthrobacter oxydans]
MEPALTSCPACGKTNRVPAQAAGRPRCGSCKAELPWIVAAGDADFAAVAEQSPVPVLVDFWAAWCGPCRMVSPVLDKLARERPGRIKLVKVDVDKSPGLSRRFDVQAIPTLMVMVDGKVAARQAGAAPAEVLRSWLDGALAGRAN